MCDVWLSVSTMWHQGTIIAYRTINFPFGPFFFLLSNVILQFCFLLSICAIIWCYELRLAVCTLLCTSFRQKVLSWSWSVRQRVLSQEWSWKHDHAIQLHSCYTKCRLNVELIIWFCGLFYTCYCLFYRLSWCFDKPIFVTIGVSIKVYSLYLIR